jgi:ppGpp synthetase/RelA/SpoT-type nucleotidyltranferase
MPQTNESTLVFDSTDSSRARSPLWMVSQEPLLNDLVSYLDKIKEGLQGNPNVKCHMRFSRGHIKLCRAAFDRMIRKGEEGLHRLCELLCETYVGRYQLQSVVIGEVPTTGERFTLTQLLSPGDLYSTIDLDLGNRQLRKLQYFDGVGWVCPNLVANVVEYQPTQPNEKGIQKIISRIKAEEELWNKVVDEIFGLDLLVKRDKELRHMSKYVKDIFGIKLVVGGVQEAARLHEALSTLRWETARLAALGLSVNETQASLRFIETKDYLHTQNKESGWEAIKSVVVWGGRMFEIQVQPLSNFWREREHLTKESHAGFKSRREQVREQIAQHLPLFGFYQKLLKWLFQNLDGPVPSFPGVAVELVD